MQIPVVQEADITIAVIPVEELDAGNSGEFKRDVGPLLQATSRLIFDLSRVRFVDSSGLGAMLSCLRHMAGRNGDLKLCGMSKQVRTLFELVRMHRIFDIYGTADEAVKAFAR